MTPILKKQLTLLCGVTLLSSTFLWNGGVLRAQDELTRDRIFPRPKLMRDEAAQRFRTLLISLNDRDNSYSGEQDRALRQSISRKSEDELKGQTQSLIAALASQLSQPNQIVRVQSEGDKTATVVVEDDPKPPTRPFILIEENGSWGVDLVETYAMWNNLEGVAKPQAMFHLFGVIMDDLPRDETLNRQICQSNLKSISLGIAQYVQDYDERYPLAKSWDESIQPYLKDESLLNCPSLPKSQLYGYAYNSKLSAKGEYLLSNPAQVVSRYETTVLKRNAYGIGENRAIRHTGGSNYAFADGHVRWFNGSKSPSFNIGSITKVPSAGPPTYGPSPAP